MPARESESLNAGEGGNARGASMFLFWVCEDPGGEMEPQTGKQSGDSMLEYESDKNDKSLAANRSGALRNRAVFSGAEKLAYSSLVSASQCRGSAMLLWYALRSERARNGSIIEMLQPW